MVTGARIAYGCCTNSLERTAAYVTPRIGNRELTITWNRTSIGAAYNQILSLYAGRNYDMVVLLHDDLELTDPLGESKLLQAILEKDVVLAGVAGGYEVNSLAWWNARTVGYQLTDTCPLNFGPRTGDVQLLEGSLLAFSRWAIDNLRFDEQFTGFHGYDDISMIARAADKRVVVTDVDTHHHTRLGFDSVESEQAWLRANELFRAKWGLT